MHPNAPSAARQSLLLALTLFLSGACALASEPLIKVVAEGGNAEGMNLTGSWEAVPEGPRGGKALKFDGSFSGRLDLKALSVEAREYDFIKLDVKADRAAQLVVSLENYPFEGALCHWYVLDGMRGPFDWRTIWIDLRQPEELKLAGQGKGMDASVPDARGLRLSGGTADTRRAIQEPGENVWLGAIRFVKQAVSLDWDQRLAPYTWGKGQDLVFTYPLRIANRLDRPLSAKLKLAPFRAEHARAELEAETVALGPKETKTVAARIVLPAEAAAAREPLYCEFFEARAEAEGLPDSEVTILRSSDPIHLSVTVPIPEEKLAYPLLGRRKDLPEYVTGYPGRGGPDAVKAAFEAGRPEDLEDVLRYGGLEMTSAWLATHNAIRKHCAAPLYADGFKQAQATGAKYENALTAAAFLYEGTGEARYLEKARALLLKAAELWAREQAACDARPFKLISEGLLADNTLHLGFHVGGTTRPPYGYERHGAFNDFDLVARDLDEAARKKIVEEFILPAGIKTRNHYVGPGNQTCTADYLTLYAGLAARNWPLVSHALSSEHGVRGQIQWAFDDDGLCLEGHYQAYTISPLLWCLEALWHRGIDLYDERFFTIVHSRGADAIGQGYKYAIVKFLDEQRFAGKPFVERFREQAGDGFHLGASTLLKWNDRQVSMNWGTHIMRGSHDRCALTIATTTAGAKGKPRRVEIGGGAYNHSSFNQAIVIVDEELQRSEPAEPLSYDVEGPVQHIVARSDKHYPGSVITRAFVLLDKHVLVLDRVASERPRTVDWCLPGAGASLSLETKEGSWTEKPDEPTKRHVFGGSIASHQAAVTGETWRDAGVNLTMLGAPNTRLLAYGGNRKGMLVRREGVQRTDYVACFGSDTKTLARVPVTKAGGAEADALGVKVELKDGTVFHALVSYEPKGTEVVLGELKTSAIFATDYSEPKRE